MQDLKQSVHAPQVSKPVRPQVAEGDTGRRILANEVAGGFREENLSAVSGQADGGPGIFMQPNAYTPAIGKRPRI